VNWETHQIGIPGATAKDNENRRIPFNPEGRRAAILKRRAKLDLDAYVFGSASGEYQSELQTAWETLRLLAHGIEPRPTRSGAAWNRGAAPADGSPLARLPARKRYGLLRNSFHPPAEIRVRTFWRQRGDHVQAVSTCIQRMQKALTQMNIQLANVISDLSGWTGQRIVRAILEGERDPQKLAALRHRATRMSHGRVVVGALGRAKEP